MKDQSYDEDIYQRAGWLITTGGYAKDMTLRDAMAMAAMQGMYAADTPDSCIAADRKAKLAYECADFMLGARNAA